MARWDNADWDRRETLLGCPGEIETTSESGTGVGFVEWGGFRISELSPAFSSSRPIADEGVTFVVDADFQAIDRIGRSLRCARESSTRIAVRTTAIGEAAKHKGTTGRLAGRALSATARSAAPARVRRSSRGAGHPPCARDCIVARRRFRVDSNLDTGAVVGGGYRLASPQPLT